MFGSLMIQHSCVDGEKNFDITEPETKEGAIPREIIQY